MVGSDPSRGRNEALIELRLGKGLSQQELAEELNRLALTKHRRHPTLSKKSVYRLESRETTAPKGFHQQLLAEFFNVEIAQLGFGRPLHTRDERTDKGDFNFGVDAHGISADVDHDQRTWLATRTALGASRRRLAILAEQLYPEYRVEGLENTGVIAHPDWLPPSPVPLDEVSLALDSAAAHPVLTGGEPESAALRPLAAGGQRYRRYHDAIRELAAPTFFENRLCYRLTGLDWSASTIWMNFGHIGFFDSMDTNEALAHETAAHHLTRDHTGQFLTAAPSWRRLAFRQLVGDPFDLARRPLMGAVGTLTIRGGDSPSIVLHQRDGARVAGGGGMTHLLPAGIFQPASVIPAAVVEDFSLWRNIEREFAEELLGHDEYDGSGRPIAYAELEPFATLDRALADGSIKVWCLGVTLDALTLCGDILTVAVIDPDLYDELFADAVSSNSEGAVPSRPLPFEGHTLRGLREHGRLSPGAAAALHFAWKHRTEILAGRH